jgi:hypothetical protein
MGSNQVVNDRIGDVGKGAIGSAIGGGSTREGVWSRAT